MNREEIKNIIPHREPMLLIDEGYAIDEVSGVGSYTVRGNEWFLQGHFPGNPVVPGVILCEMMAQSCCVVLGNRIKGFNTYFTGIDNVRFKNKVRPGDVFDIECTMTRIKHPFYFVKVRGSVDGKLCVSGEFSFALVK